MRLADDDRARVPFALVGVLLLVGSAGLSATLAGGPTPRTDDSVGVAVDRVTAATNTALRGAVARAGRRAAAAPVTDPANTTAGRVLNDSTPFRDSLRVRVALAVREALDSVEGRSEGVSAGVSLPPVRNASALRRAKRGVEISPAGGEGDASAEHADHAGLRVTVENVTVTARRGGRVVEREQFSPTLVVATPALALHERVERFESRLNRGALAPGLGQRLTARLYAVAWARGYAQYGRAPIENVIGNRHVELATNGAVLREQRAAFGRSDPAGRRALGWATARVGATDLLAAANAHAGSQRTELLLAAARDYQRDNPMPGGVTSGRGDRDSADGSRSRRTDDLRAGVNRTADRAFSALVAGENGTGLHGLLRSAYAADARRVATVRRLADESERRPSLAAARPGRNWTMRSSEVVTTTAAGPAPAGSATGPPGIPSGWHLLDHAARRVVQTKALVSNWTRGNDSRRTVQEWTETFAVRVGVAGDHGVTVGEGDAGPAPAPPARPVAGVHEEGRALDGPNLRGVAATATDRLVASAGGFDALARRAVEGTLDTRPQTVTGRRPAGLREWVYRDLAALRERVRNLSVAVPRARTLGGRPPAAELARLVRSRRADLLDAPARYDGVADRARVAARAAYLDRVAARLDSRADRANATRTGLKRALAGAGSSLDRVRRVFRARTTPPTPEPRAMPADGPGRDLNLSVSGAPPYLTLASLDHEQVAAIPADGGGGGNGAGEADGADGADGAGGESGKYHPLAARNHNVFAVPYGDAAKAVVSAVAGGGASDSADLRTAAAALRAANRTLAETENRTNRTLVERRNRLQDALSASMAAVRDGLVAELTLSRFDLTEAERRGAVASGLARWNTTAERAAAVANGSAAGAIAAAVVQRRPPLGQSVRRDWVGLRAELAVESVRQSVEGPPRKLVNRTGAAARTATEKALTHAASNALANATELASKRWFGEVLGAIPAGLPVAPVPGYWYATVNVWTVSVRGEYARFAVGAPQGPPGESVSYVREAGTVEFDWDADGESEVVGRTAPVSFETGTTVAVVVPPGPPGVGDRDGKRDETSPGWSAG